MPTGKVYDLKYQSVGCNLGVLWGPSHFYILSYSIKENPEKWGKIILAFY